MIRTVTLNTGFDELYVVDRYAAGDVGYLRRRETLASGKGINAARVIAALRSPVIAYGLVGGEEQKLFEQLLDSSGVGHRLVAIAQPTRRNLTVIPTDDDEPAAHFRADGFDACPDGVGALSNVLANELREDDVVVLSGSSLDGSGDDWLHLAKVVSDSGCSVICDVYGRNLSTIIKLLRPAVAKPNLREAETLGHSPVIEQLRAMAGMGVGLPIITCGAEGVLFADGPQIRELRLPVARPRIVVGAGDVFAGALAAAMERGSGSKMLILDAATVAAAYVSGSPMSELRTTADKLRRSAEMLDLGH